MSYMNFVEIKDTKTKTKQFYIQNITSLDILGYIIFFPRWRKYVFKPRREVETVFDNTCLNEISKFCEDKTKEWKNEFTKAI